MSFLLLLARESPNTTRQVQIFGHDGDALAMDRAQVGILKQGHQMGFRSFLQCLDCGALPTVGLSRHLHLDLSNQARKGQLANQHVSAFLVLTDFPESFFTCG